MTTINKRNKAVSTLAIAFIIIIIITAIGGPYNYYSTTSSHKKIVIYEMPAKFVSAEKFSGMPVHSEKADPSGTFALNPGYYLTISIQILNGMNVTFQVSSNVTLDVYFMSASQFANFESTGSAQAIYHSQGSYVKANIGPFLGGTYYLVIYNDLSSQAALGSYGLYTLPVNIYSYYSSLPAPVGLADYGVLNASGVLYPYRILYKEAIGVATIYSLQAYNSNPPSGVDPYGASLQQNVVLQVNTTSGNYEYWLQDVAAFVTDNYQMYIEDNVWNYSASTSYLTDQTITGNGDVYPSGNEYYYAYGTSSFSYSLPLTIHFYTKFNYSYNAVYVYFGYSLGSSSVNWYDTVTIHDSGVRSASLVVSGYNSTPRGTFYDSELVFGGESNGEQTDFTQMNANLNIYYELLNGSSILPPAVYGFGSDTLEAADDLSTELVNGTPTVVIGSGNFEPVGYSVSVPEYSAQISLQTSPVDAGVNIPVKIVASVSNGMAPYTYVFYINDKPVYNFTTYSSSYSGTVYLPPLSSGMYSLQAAVYDALGRADYSSVYTVFVNPDPVPSITSNISVTDIGLPFNFSYFVHFGTPPYNFSFYVNGKLITKGYGSYSSYLGSDVFIPEQPGTWTAELVVTDSAGCMVTDTYSVTVNPDPTISVSGVSKVLDVNMQLNLSAYGSSGTAPYYYSWFVNGSPVSSSQSYHFRPALAGNYNVTVIMKDSAGYRISYQTTIKVFPDPVISISVLRKVYDAGQLINVSETSSLGAPPYTIVYYINGSQASGSLINLTAPGNYIISAKLTDSLGYSVTSNAVRISVLPDPKISISVPRTVYDAGQLLILYVSASEGAPPYTITYYLNNTQFNGNMSRLSLPGTYSLYAVLTDSLGYQVRSNAIALTVNPDPAVTYSHSLSSNSFLYSNNIVTVTIAVKNGTPPYTYTWYLNGQQVSVTSSPAYTYQLSKMGLNVINISIKDSAGYTVSDYFTVNYTYNYLNIALIAIVVIAALSGIVLLFRSRGKEGSEA
ncbi:MAG: thermopsin [Nitrososphaeria archaeon]